MAGERLLVPVEDVYIAALGRAAYVFATLEWNVVWCCERMQPQYINNLRKKTAGKIAREFVSLVNRLPNAELKGKCVSLALDFARLVDLRNAIMHGIPGTAPDGSQRLFRNGVAWTPEMIEAATDEFTVCSRNINVLLHSGDLALNFVDSTRND